MKNSTLSPIHLEVDHAGRGVVSHAGIVLPARVAETSGLVEGLSQALAPWRAPTAAFEPGHMLTQLALAVAAGGDHLVDVRGLAGADTIVGPLPSHATISRLLTTLAGDVDRVESAAHQAISRVREYVSTCGTGRNTGQRCGRRARRPRSSSTSTPP